MVSQKNYPLTIGRLLFKNCYGHKVYATNNPNLWAWTHIGRRGIRVVYAYQRRYKFKPPKWGS